MTDNTPLISEQFQELALNEVRYGQSSFVTTTAPDIMSATLDNTTITFPTTTSSSADQWYVVQPERFQVGAWAPNEVEWTISTDGRMISNRHTIQFRLDNANYRQHMVGDWDFDAERARLQTVQLKSKLRSRRERRLPNARALDLLRDICTPQQWQEFRFRNHVTCVGSDGGIYQIGGSKNWLGGVLRLDAKGEPVEKLCIHARLEDGREYPLGDRMAALILAVQADEKRFLEVAISHGAPDKVTSRRVKAGRFWRHRAA